MLHSNVSKYRKSGEHMTENVLKNVGEYGPRAMKISLNIFFLKNIEPLVPSFKV